MAGAASMVRAGAKNQPQDAVHLVHIRYLGRTTPPVATFQAVLCRSWSEAGCSESNLEDTVNYWAAWMLMPVFILVLSPDKITVGGQSSQACIDFAFQHLCELSIVHFPIFKRSSLLPHLGTSSCFNDQHWLHEPRVQATQYDLTHPKAFRNRASQRGCTAPPCRRAVLAAAHPQ